MWAQPHCLVVVYKSAELGWSMHSSFQREGPLSQGLCRQSQALSGGHCNVRRNCGALGW